MHFPGELRSTAFIRALPKAELHLHLEGTVDPVTLLELRQRHRKSGSLEEIEQLYRYQDFTGFLMAFKAVTEDLRTAEDYELITYRLMEKLKAENILHAEVYVSVGVCLWREQDFPAIFQGLQGGENSGSATLGFRCYGFSTLSASLESRQPARWRSWRYASRPSVVGFGIGGDERKAGPELFRDVYAYAAENGLRLTIHAGETVGPESIWGGLNLRAERIGHALSAWQDTELVEELATRQIPVESCITSNLRTGCLPALNDHPVRNYFRPGIMITLNTDDPAMFRTSLSHEYYIAQQSFGFNDEHLREVARNSFEASFLPAEKKLQFLNLFDAAVVRP